MKGYYIVERVRNKIRATNVFPRGIANIVIGYSLRIGDLLEYIPEAYDNLIEDEMPMYYPGVSSDHCNDYSIHTCTDGEMWIFLDDYSTKIYYRGSDDPMRDLENNVSKELSDLRYWNRAKSKFERHINSVARHCLDCLLRT
jgi:hypothetical protein